MEERTNKPFYIIFAVLLCVSFLAWILQSVKVSNAKNYIFDCEQIFLKAQKEGKECWTYSGQKTVMLNTIDEILKKEYPFMCNQEILDSFVDFMQNLKKLVAEWNTEWSLIGNFLVGTAGGVTEYYTGGSGIGVAIVMKLIESDVSSKNNANKNFTNSVDKWNHVKKKYSMESSF